MRKPSHLATRPRSWPNWVSFWSPSARGLNVAVHQRDHRVGIFLAGDAEDVADAFVLEAADEQIGRFHGITSPNWIFNVIDTLPFSIEAAATAVNRQKRQGRRC